MDVKKQKYCSVCFRALEIGYELIDNPTVVMLHVLTIELNWDSNEELFLCKECAEIVKQSYDFKLISLDRINRYWVEGDGWESKHPTASCKSTETDILKEYTTCTLCTRRVKSDKVLSINILLNDSNIKELYSRCMADIELDDIKGVMICIPCREKFEAYFNFVGNYLKIKETIEMNFKNGTFNGNMNQEKLRNIHNFLFATTTEPLCVSTEISEIKREKNDFEDYKQHEAPCETLKHEEIDVKNDIVVMNTEGQETYNLQLQMQSQNLNHISNSIVHTPVTCTYETEAQIYHCVSCTYESKPLEELENRTVVHQDPSERDTCNCNSCKNRTPCKNALTKHKLAPTTALKMQRYKCASCTYKSIYKSDLRSLLLTHRAISEVATYKCESCTYQTKHKGSLKRHILIHKSISKVTTYTCESCTFETKRKAVFKYHILIHKRNSELQVSQTKHKDHLKIQGLNHKSNSEVATYKCESCTYETKFKSNLQRHILTHKSISEVKSYKCDRCTYATKLKCNLKIHGLTHKSTSEVETYKCESCTFETKHKDHLKIHDQCHKSNKCESCTFETKHKGCLKRHIIIHKNNSEVKTYKCESCTYETKRKDALKVHDLIHKSISEVEMYKCENCTFKTKYKISLRHHILLVHENNS